MQADYRGDSWDIQRGYDDADSIVSRAFFSDENIELLQKKLVVETFRRTGIKIPFQQPERLTIAMKSIYNLYAKNLPSKYTEQVRELDALVVERVMPDIIVALEQHEAYLRILDGDRPLLEPPINVSNRTSLPGSRL